MSLVYALEDVFHDDGLSGEFLQEIGQELINCSDQQKSEISLPITCEAAMYDRSRATEPHLEWLALLCQWTR